MERSCEHVDGWKRKRVGVCRRKRSEWWAASWVARAASVASRSGSSYTWSSRCSSESVTELDSTDASLARRASRRTLSPFIPSVLV